MICSYLLQQYGNSHVMRDSIIGLIAGIAIMCVGVYWARLGKVWDNIYGWSSRKERPIQFWIELLSVFGIATYLILSSLANIFNSTMS